MNRYARMALVLLLVLALGALVTLILAESQAAPWIPWSLAARTDHQSGRSRRPCSRSGPHRNGTGSQVAGRHGRGCGPARPDRLRRRPDRGCRIRRRPAECHTEYACTRATFTEIAHWLVTVPIVVKTSYIDYRTSFLVKVAVTDGRIIQLTPALGYRRIY